MRAVIIAAATATFVFAISAGAALAEWRNLERVAAIDLQINDSVTDGCWPRPEATREAVELLFRGANIPVAEHMLDSHPLPSSQLEAAGFAGGALVPDHPHQFSIAARGWYDMGCIVSIHIELSRLETLAQWGPNGAQSEERYMGIIEYGSFHGLLTGPKPGMQSSITDTAVEAATTLANSILKARTY